MTRVILNDSLRSQLPDLDQPLELVDEAGRILGRYTPANLEPQVSEEELDRREQSNEKRYTTAEVLAYLEKL